MEGVKIAQNLSDLEKNWTEFGEKDPLWAISTADGKRGGKWEINEFFQTGNNEIEKIMRHVKLLGIKIENNHALDFGCGVGRLTQAMANFFNVVDGVDISPSMIDLARKYNQFGDRVRYHLNNKNDLSIFDDNSYDLIYTTDVFQHMSPQYMEGYITELLRVLSPEGLLIFQLPSEHIKLSNKLKSLFGLNRRIYSLYGKITHQPVMEYHLTPKRTVEAILVRNNAELIDAVRDSRKIVISYVYYVRKN